MQKNTIIGAGLLVCMVLGYYAFEEFNKPRVPDLNSSLVSMPKDMFFGVTIGSASGNIGDGKVGSIDLENSKKEIDVAADLGAGLVRFNLEREMLEDTKEAGELEEIIAYARGKKMKICLAFLGRESWLNQKAGWEDFKKTYREDVDFLNKTYSPDYVMILPQCPSGIGAQINTEISLQDWLDFAKETGLSIKKKNFDIGVIIEENLSGSGSADNMQKDFVEKIMIDNDPTIDIISLAADSIEDLEPEMKQVNKLKDKNHWSGKIWMGNIGYAATGENYDYAQKNFFLYCIHLAGSNGYPAVVISRLRDNAGESRGIIREDFSEKDSYKEIRRVVKNIR